MLSKRVRVDTLRVRLFLFNDLLLLTVDTSRLSEALEHFGRAQNGTNSHATLFDRIRKSVATKKHSAGSQPKRTVQTGPPTGKFACGTADLARAIAHTESLTVLDYAIVSPRTLRVALINTQNPSACECYPPECPPNTSPPNDSSPLSYPPNNTSPLNYPPNSTSQPNNTDTQNQPRTASVSRNESKLRRALSTVQHPNVASLNSSKRRRKSSSARQTHPNANFVDLDAAIRSYCEQQCAANGSPGVNGNTNGKDKDGNTNGNDANANGKNADGTQSQAECASNILRLSLLENGCGVHAEYAFRFAAESDALRWFDALASAIANRNVASHQPSPDSISALQTSSDVNSAKQDTQSSAKEATQNSVKEGTPSTQNSTKEDTPSSAKQQSTKESTPSAVYTALRPHNPSYGEELEVVKGDSVILLKRTADGWCKGQLVDTAKTGWFRSVCIE